MAYHRHRHSSRRRNKKGIINKTVSVAQSTSKKYMPKVKSGFENLGNKVIQTGEKTIPYLQRMTRKFFGLFSRKSTRKHRSN